MQRQQLALRRRQTTSTRIRAPLDATKILQFVISVGEQPPVLVGDNCVTKKTTPRVKTGGRDGGEQMIETVEVVCRGSALD